MFNFGIVSKTAMIMEFNQFLYKTLLFMDFLCNFNFTNHWHGRNTSKIDSSLCPTPTNTYYPSNCPREPMIDL